MENIKHYKQIDGWLEPYNHKIDIRDNYFSTKCSSILSEYSTLRDFANTYEYYGLRKQNNTWLFREWAPNAEAIFLVGDFNNWTEDPDYKLTRLNNGNWEILLSENKIKEKQLYKLSIHWAGGKGERLPSHVSRVVQDEHTKTFSAQVWITDQQYTFTHPSPVNSIKSPLVYEAHVGMASEEDRVGSYKEFTTNVLPRVRDNGYNVLQLMAVQEHPYYGSFGYHVSNFFACSSRFGTPDELKELIDTAHGMGMAVIMDIVHSHSVKNELEGLGRFDGSEYQYFHTGYRREHVAWDSLCFDYGKNEVIRFLLSNCRYWIEEFNFDGFRFDGVTSMIYLDHGLSRDFVNYGMYYDGNQDEDAIVYLKLANKLIHEIKPGAITIAEEMSGMPGMAYPVEGGGLGFDRRLSMGIPDYWIKIIKEKADEEWNMSQIFHELTTRRPEEKTINYAESHDQALVGDKTIIFRLIDKEMYWHMNVNDQNLIIDRGIALHKLIRLVTISTSIGGYLNFMGNEFGHPEWIDFPREGNNWSYKYAKRQWSLAYNEELKYKYLLRFDNDMINLIKQSGIIENSYPESLHENNGDNVLAFKRGELVFIFNFNPDRSFTNYGVHVPAGKYATILTSDDERYGGFERVDKNMIFYAKKEGKLSIESPFLIYMYLPSRSAIVLKHTPTASVRDKFVRE